MAHEERKDSASVAQFTSVYGPSLPVKIDGSSRVLSGWGALPSVWGFGFVLGVLVGGVVVPFAVFTEPCLL